MVRTKESAYVGVCDRRGNILPLPIGFTLGQNDPSSESETEWQSNASVRAESEENKSPSVSESEEGDDNVDDASMLSDEIVPSSNKRNMKLISIIEGFKNVLKECNNKCDDFVKNVNEAIPHIASGPEKRLEFKTRVGTIRKKLDEIIFELDYAEYAIAQIDEAEINGDDTYVDI